MPFQAPVIVDYHSKYFEVCHLQNDESDSVINNMKKVFSRHGIPKKVFFDNGPQKIQAIRPRKWDFVLLQRYLPVRINPSQMGW